MSRKPGIAIAVAFLGTVAAAAAALALKGPVLEAWHIHRLGSSDREQRMLAAERLGAVGSPRAVPFLLEAADGEDQRKIVIESLVRIGPRAVPALHRALDAERREVRRAAIMALRELKPQGRVRIDLNLALLGEEGFREGERQEALRVLRSLSPLPGDVIAKVARSLEAGDPPPWIFELLGAQGPAAARAVPALDALLIEALRAWKDQSRVPSILGTPQMPSPSLRAAGLAAMEHPEDSAGAKPAPPIGALVGRGSEAVPHLIAALRGETSVELRCRIYEVLARLGPGAAAARGAVLDGIDDRDPGARAWAITALRFLGPPGSEVPPALRGLLADADAGVRLAACAALIAQEGGRPETVDAVVDALTDRGGLPGDPESPATASRRGAPAGGYLARLVAFALAERLTAPDGMVDGRIVGRMVDALGSGMSDAVVYALRFIAKHGPHFASAVPRLAELARKEDANREVEIALGEIGAPAVPALVDLLSLDDAGVRRRAAAALAKIGPAAAPALPALLSIAGSEGNQQARAAAMGALGAIGAAKGRGAYQIQPELLETANRMLHRAAEDDEPPEVRLAALGALARVAPDSPGTAGALAAELQRPGPLDRSGIILALADIGPAASAAAPALVEALGDKDVYIRIFALQALGRIGATQSGALEAIAGALGNGEFGIRRTAAGALRALGPAASGALPALVKALGDETIIVRLAAAEAIWAIERGHPAVLPALEAARANPDPHYRVEAVRVLGKIARDSREALEMVRSALDDREPAVRVAACEGLVALGLDLDGVLRVLVPILDVDASVTRWIAIDLLGQLGPRATEAIPRLEALLWDRDPGVRGSARKVFAAIRTAGTEAAPR